MNNLEIISDGTTLGTYVISANGDRIAGVTSIEIPTIEGHGIITATLTFENVKLDMKAAVTETAEESTALDAARYRWLRAQHWNTSKIFVVSDMKANVRTGTYCPSEKLLDAHIDSAMSVSINDQETKQ